MKRTATLEACDNPDCDVERETSKDLVALGFYFEIGSWHNTGGGGPIPRTYACSRECIAAALWQRILEDC